MYIAHNGQQILLDVFFLDTQQTVFNRITWIVNSLPEFVYIPEEIIDNFKELDESKEIFEPIDLWSMASKSNNLLELIRN